MWSSIFIHRRTYIEQIEINSEHISIIIFDFKNIVQYPRILENSKKSKTYCERGTLSRDPSKGCGSKADDRWTRWQIQLDDKGCGEWKKKEKTRRENRMKGKRKQKCNHAIGWEISLSNGRELPDHRSLIATPLYRYKVLLDILTRVFPLPFSTFYFFFRFSGKLRFYFDSCLSVPWISEIHI